MKKLTLALLTLTISALTLWAIVAIPPLDASGSITAGGTSQQLVDIGTSPTYFFFENVSTENLWVDYGVAAVQDKPSTKVVPNGSIVFECSYIPQGKVYVIGATTGSKFVCKYR